MIRTILRSKVDQLLSYSIPTNSLITLYHSLLLEKRLILLSNDPSKLSLFIDSLLNLLSPLSTSSFTVISNLKEQYLEFLDAPVPYIIGLSKEIWDQEVSIFQIRQLETDSQVLAYYIDKDIFLIGHTKSLVRSKFLRNSLNNLKLSLNLIELQMQRMMTY